MHRSQKTLRINNISMFIWNRGDKTSIKFIQNVLALNVTIMSLCYGVRVGKHCWGLITRYRQSSCMAAWRLALNFSSSRTLLTEGSEPVCAGCSQPGIIQNKEHRYLFLLFYFCILIFKSTFKDEVDIRRCKFIYELSYCWLACELEFSTTDNNLGFSSMYMVLKSMRIRHIVARGNIDVSDSMPGEGEWGVLI